MATLQSSISLPCDGKLDYLPEYFSANHADKLLTRLTDILAWKQETLSIMGRQIITPRMVCWYGDDEAVYRYSGVDHIPLPWTEELQDIRKSLRQSHHHHFNSVLGNLYRNGQDSMGWHADKESQLGKNPVIASLSLGATRQFRLKHNKSGQTVNIELEHGSLLIMSGSLQHHWRHCLPKTRRPVQQRINLTFRSILSSSK
ncbi:MAG: alpha-ketoglutarate-dependent dioxygenase AlkB [Gammaproteobacteria bacterium]|nr:alpha-ketoglutarate-dependent dioxygenase AlkB [Gammaproteobacteria bacterium]